MTGYAELTETHVLAQCGLSRRVSSDIDDVLSFLSPRCQLFVRPAGCFVGQFGPSSTCVAWKEQVHQSSEVRSVLQCPATDSSLLPLMISTVAVPDKLRHIASRGEEDWDPAYIIHLYPMATLRNLLPYTVSYMMEVQCSRQIHIQWKVLQRTSTNECLSLT